MQVILVKGLLQVYNLFLVIVHLRIAMLRVQFVNISCKECS